MTWTPNGALTDGPRRVEEGPWAEVIVDPRVTRGDSWLKYIDALQTGKQLK